MAEEFLDGTDVVAPSGFATSPKFDNEALPSSMYSSWSNLGEDGRGREAMAEGVISPNNLVDARFYSRVICTSSSLMFKT